MRNEYLIAGASVIGVAVGAAGGYIVASKRLGKQFDEALEREITEAKEFYSRVNKSGDYSTPESAAEKLVGEAADAMLKYQGRHPSEKSLEDEASPVEVVVRSDGDDIEVTTEDVEEDVTNNIFQTTAESIDTSNRNSEEPYIITLAEWMENPNDHDQVQCTYYEGDGVVADERDKPVADSNRCVGLGNLEKFGVGEDPNVLLIRNERLRVDYEVLRSTGKFAHEVMGFEHADDTFRRSPRKQHLSDD